MTELKPIDFAHLRAIEDAAAAVLDGASTFDENAARQHALAVAATPEAVRAMAYEIRMHRDAMAPYLLRAARLYTDELGALRKRVAEIEELHAAAARANEALEAIGEQARQRILQLATGLREALDSGFDRVLDVRMYERLYQLAERSLMETAAETDRAPSPVDPPK